MLKDRTLELSALMLVLTGDPLLARQLAPEDFSDETLADILGWLQQSMDKSNTVNITSVQDKFDKKYKHDPYTWLSWINEAPYMGPGYQVIERLRELRARREAKKFAVSGDSPDKFPEQFRSKGREIEQLITIHRPSMQEIALQLMAGVNVTPTGYSEMDEMLNGGIEDGGMMVIAARPGKGKTALAINIAKRLVANKKGVFFGSLEMPQDRILERFFQVFWEETSAGVRRKAQEMAQMDATFTIEQLSYDIDRIIATMTANLDHDIFILDYYQLIQMSGKESQIQKLELISNRLKQFAFENKKPLIVLAQLNRSIETDTRNREPEMSDLRGCGALEQDAHIVSFLWSPEDKAQRDDSKKSTAEKLANKAPQKKPGDNYTHWIVRKNRNGRIGTVYLDFKPQTMTFSEAFNHSDQ